MGLYQFKDFLTLREVAEYLLSKALVPPVPAEQIYLSHILPFLFELEQTNRLTPVFDYDGWIIIIDAHTHEVSYDTYRGKILASNAMLKCWRNNKAVTYKPFKGQFKSLIDAIDNQRYQTYGNHGEKNYSLC